MPFDGDLTRLGGYSEHDYGWNDKQSFLISDLSVKGEIGVYYDIMVVGDSFSHQQPWGRLWHNYLNQDPDLSVGVFYINDFKRILDSSFFKANPPKILIYESVERLLRSRFHNSTGIGCIDNKIKIQKNKLILDAVKTKKYFERDDSFTMYIGHSIKHLWNLFKWNWRQSPVVRHQLVTEKLFTNSKSDELLTISHSLRKSSWSDGDWSEIGCRMLELQQKIESNGVTGMAYLIAPDKISIYGEYLLDSKYKNLSKLPFIYNFKDLNTIPLVDLFKLELSQGSKDLYLPNDTHWGGRGHEIAGKKTAVYFSVK
jgi:hypothetical protein